MNWGEKRCFKARKIERTGGGAGIRTPDPLLAKQVLSRLSYTPMVLWLIPEP